MNRNASQSFAVGALLLFAAVAGLFRIRAYDLFWHLAAGRWIVENNAVPRTDPFRFSSEGLPWVDHGWLFQVVARFVEMFGGLDALIVLRAGIAVGLAFVLWSAVKRSGAGTAAAVIVAALAVLGARPRLMLRPEIVSVAATALLLFVLQEMRRARAVGVWPTAAAALVVVWANMHAGALVAPVVAAVFLLGSRLPGGAGPGRGGEVRPGWGRVVLVPALLAVAVAANPWGFDLYGVPSGIRSALEGVPIVNPEWLPLWEAPQPGLIVGAALIATLALTTVVRVGRLDPATGLVVAALGALAAGSVRHQGLFFVGAAFLAGECLGDLARGRQGSAAPASNRFGEWIAVTVCALAAAWCVWTPDRGPLRARIGPYSFGTGLEPGRFPEQAARELATWPEARRPYNDAAFGGYLSWNRYPEPVFLDGRNEVDPGLLVDVARGRSDSRAWDELIRKHEIDSAVVRYDDRLREVAAPDGQTTMRRTTHALLFPRARWALVHWDDTAMVFVARTGGITERLARREYRFVDPEDRVWVLERAGADAASLADALSEVERKLREDPGCVRAVELKEALLELEQRG